MKSHIVYIVFYVLWVAALMRSVILGDDTATIASMMGLFYTSIMVKLERIEDMIKSKID